MAKDFNKQFPLVYSHRCFAGLYPENTLIGLKHSLDLDIDAIDIDIVLSQDKVFMVYHDLYLNKETTRDNNGLFISKSIPIHSLSAKTLKGFNVGQVKKNSLKAKEFPHQKAYEFATIPTLEEILIFVQKFQKKNLRYQIEVKIPLDFKHYPFPLKDYINLLSSLLKHYHVTSLTEVQCFNWDFLIELKKALPNVETAFLYDDLSSSNEEQIIHTIKKFKGSIAGPYFPLVSKSLVQLAHKEGLKVVPWSIDEPKDMKKFISYNVDGIITNRPDLLIKIIKKLKKQH